jgi:hypothetical protein
MGALSIGMQANSFGKNPQGSFPSCRPLRISAPGGRWTLFSPTLAPNCPTAKDPDPAAQGIGNDYGVELFLEDVATHHRRAVTFEGYDGEAGWSRSGLAFFVNDHIGSNSTESSLFFADSLRSIDVARAIRIADPDARRYFEVHSYFCAKKWLDDRTALVQLCGHTDEYPSMRFDFRYRVDLDGHAQRLSQSISAAAGHRYDCE